MNKFPYHPVLLPVTTEKVKYLIKESVMMLY